MKKVCQFHEKKINSKNIFFCNNFTQKIIIGENEAEDEELPEDIKTANKSHIDDVEENLNNDDQEFQEEESIENSKDQDFEEEVSIENSKSVDENNESLPTEQNVQDTEEYPNDITNPEDNLNQDTIANELMGDDLTPDVQDSTTTQDDHNVLANTDINYCKCITDQINNSKKDEPNPDNNDEDIATTDVNEESKLDEEEENGVASDAAPDKDEKEPEKTSAAADDKQEGLLISRIFCYNNFIKNF